VSLALELWLAGWLLVAAVMLGLWLIQLRTRDATLVDVGWTANLGLLAIFYALGADGAPGRRWLVAVLAGAWSLRLALHLLRSRVLDPLHGEDRRYAALRERWGERAPRNFFWVYQAQALLDSLLSLPFLLACLDSQARLGPAAVGAGLLLLLSVAGEWVADQQLLRFKSDPANRGRTCRTGLWRVSRHPNYFFEWLAWCAFALLALPAPLGWLGLSAPLIMLLLLLKVTGVPPAEEQAVSSRGDDYRAYQRSTSAFFPWFPKEGTT